MKLKLITLACIALVNIINSQKKFLEVKIEHDKPNTRIQNAYLIENPSDQSLYAFLEEAKTTYGFRYDKDRVLTSKLVSEGLKRKYKEIIGHAVENNQLRLIQKNEKGNKFASILYDFNKGETIESEYSLQMTNEKFIQSFSHKNNCYVFTLNTSKHKITKWTFKIDGTYHSELVSLEIDTSSSTYKITSIDLNKLLTITSGLKTEVNMVKIDNRFPNNLEITCEANKMYEHDNGFIWTLDKDSKYTVLTNFELPDLKPHTRVISKPILNGSKNKTNSYLFEVDKIAQIVSNNNALGLYIKALEDFDIIKSFYVEKTDSIPFKNSPILQEGSTYSFGSTREMKKTSKFLRKISSDKNGISIYKTENSYVTIVGGVRVQASGAMMPMPGFGGFGGIPLAQFGSVTMSFNPVAYAYGSYNSIGSTRIECLFDNDFNHKKGKIGDNVFDRINTYEDKLSNISADNVFVINNTTLFGFYQSAINTYHLIAFE